MSNAQEIESLAEYLAEYYFPSDKIDPILIADKIGITHSYGHYEDAFDGLLEYRNARFHIYVNLDRLSAPQTPRARFTIGHELGHYYIDDHRNALVDGRVGPHSSFTDYQSTNPAEMEADSFSAALLMPMNRFKSAARKRLPGAKCILDLADQFDTSISSTAIRYARSNTHSVSVMRWTRSGRKWCWSSNDFKETTNNKAYKDLKKIPSDSLTRSMLDMNETDSSKKGSTLSTWFPFIKNGSKDDGIVVEEVISLRNYGVLTILYPA